MTQARPEKALVVSQHHPYRLFGRRMRSRCLSVQAGSVVSHLTAQRREFNARCKYRADDNSLLDAVEQTVVSGEECELNAIGSTDLVEDVHEMGFDRVFSDRRSLGNLLV